ncbi:hypothetical protein LB507_007580 [Fusarium sp. FIESC RH6]|nr:hypothetical protein LB507_007580 [Fusarium sp. FIESC RH6]
MEGLQTPGEVMEDVFLQDDLGPTIAEHATQCQSLFNKYMTMSDIVPDPTIMDDQLARFSLWTSNMDVYGPPNVSLDYRLRFSPTAADIIHQLLEVICDTLMSLKPIDQRPPQTPSRKRQRISVHGDSGPSRMTDDYSSDSDSDMDPAEGNILKITETIGGTMTRLFRLSNAVRKSAKANRARKIQMYTDDQEANKAIEELRLYTKCYIEFRFPEAPETLRTALVEANALRLRRLYYQHSHRRRIDLSIQSPGPSPAAVTLPKMNQNTPTVRFAPSPMPKPATITKMSAASPAPATNATTARQTAVAALYAKSTTEVPRAKSVLVNNKLSFPPMPPTQQCPYCGVIIEFKNGPKSLLWQNHVIGDLEPFVCIFSQCLQTCHGGPNTSPLTFETSKAWSNHMQNAHGQTWECRAPSHDPKVFEQEIEYRQHSIEEHGVPEAYAATLSNAARRPVINKVLECPFGDDFQPPEKAGSSVVFSTEALQAHVAGHMKEIALLTLQKLPTDGDENVENVDSDQPLEDDGTTGPYGITRASMCSILDDESFDFPDDDDAAVNNAEHREEQINEGVTNLNLKDKVDLGISKLRHAVHTGNLALIESLIQSGTEVNSKDENGQTPLHYAAERGLIDCIKVLVDHGADLRITDDSGFSPTLWAVISGQEHAAQHLLFESTYSLVTNTDMDSALTWAARMGRTAIARTIIARVGLVLGTHLQEAAASGHISIVTMLLDYGYDPNHRDRDGWSAIHYAAEEGHLEIIRLLLKFGAELNAVSSYGTSPLHCAANGGHLSIVNMILQTGDIDICKSTCHGWTALHHAVYMGHCHLVPRLIEYDPNIALQQDNHGWSAMHLAVLGRDVAIIGTLGLAESPMLLDESGLTAEDWLYRWRKGLLQKAKGDLAFSSVPLIQHLINSGHDINGVDSGMRTAFYYAARKCMLPTMDILIAHGADPNILPTGRTDWEEFIPVHSVLLRLSAAGYKKPEVDDKLEGYIHQVFQAQKQLLVGVQSALSLLEESNLPGLGQPVSQRTNRGPEVSTNPPSRVTSSPAPTQQTNDNKRKARSSRVDWWKRLIGRK